MTTRILLLVIGTGIGIVLLVLLLRSVNAAQLGTDLSQADYRLLLLTAVPWLAAVLLKVPRWALLYGSDAPAWDTLFGAMNVGYAVNTLLPARLGELVRAYWVRDRSSVSMVRSLTTILVERVTDGVTLVILLLVTAPTVAFPGKLLGPALTIGAVFFGVLVAMGVLAFSSGHSEAPLARWLRRFEGTRLAPVVRIFSQVLRGFHVLRNGRAVALLVVYTLLIWAPNVSLAWVALAAFRITVPVTGAILLTAVLNLGMAIPSSPGYVGVYEYLMVLTLALYGVPHTPALAAAFAYHAISFVPVAVIGLVYIARAGVESTASIVRMSARQGETARGR